MKRKILLGTLAALSVLCLSLGLAACGEEDDGQIGFAFRYDEDREAYAVTGMVNLPTDEQIAEDSTLSRPESITVPAEHAGSPVYIGDGAFAGYTFLKSVTLEEGVLSVGSSAFSGCTALGEINFPEGLLSVGDGAFTNCALLTEVALPASLEQITAEAFFGCSSVKTVTVSGQNAAFSAVGNILYDKAQTQIVYAPARLEGEVALPASFTTVARDALSGHAFITKVTVPANVKTIGASAFSDCAALEEVVLPAGLEKIGEGVFANDPHLKTIEFPASVTEIPANAFEDCDALTTVDIPATVTKIGPRAFSSCRSLASVTLPEDLTQIPDGLFEDCGNLTAAVIPDTVTAIGSYAFSGCVSLAELAIPAKTLSIGEKAFFGCSGLQEISVADGNTAYHAAGNCLIETATNTLLYGSNQGEVPADVVRIAPHAFRFMAGLETLSLPLGLTEIGEEAFLGCSGLKSIAVAEGNAAFLSKDGILYRKTAEGTGNAAGYAFHTVPIALEGEIAVLDGIKEIPANTFEYRLSLKAVTLPAGLNTIGSSAFAHCEQLASVTLPKDITSVGANAFAYCTQLTSFELPDGSAEGESVPMTSFANYVFLGCSSLTEVKLGSRVSSVNANMFENCNALARITVSGENKRYRDVGGILYSIREEDGEVSYSGIVHVPMKLAGAVAIPEGISSISAEAFYGRTEITSVTLPKSLTSIGSYAFGACSGITAAYFTGDAAAWAKVNVASGNDALTAVLVFNAGIQN